MPDAEFFSNPHFIDYAKAMIDLHRLIQEERDETAAAEKVGKRLDDATEHLGRDEIDALDDLHELLGKFSDRPHELAPCPHCGKSPILEANATGGQAGSNTDEWSVACPCGATGPSFGEWKNQSERKCKRLAAEAWNKLNNSPATKKE